MHTASVDIRSYAQQGPEERHSFVQIVVPVTGEMEIDVNGHQQRLSVAKGALIAGNTVHSIVTSDANRSLVIDVDEHLIPEKTLETFANRPFINLTRRSTWIARHMGKSLAGGESDTSSMRLWAGLLVGSFTDERTDTAARLLTLKTLIEIDPFQPWPVERMAHEAEISTSRLHLLFQNHFGTTPHQWIADMRMRRICALLSGSSVPIAEIAQRAGFSDQTALTRAMRKSLGVTPAAYRRSAIS